MELISNYTPLLNQNIIFFLNQNKQLHSVEGKRKSVSWDMFCVRFCSLWAYWYNWKKKLTINKPVWVNEDWSKPATKAWNKQELISFRDLNTLSRDSNNNKHNNIASSFIWPREKT